MAQGPITASGQRKMPGSNLVPRLKFVLSHSRSPLSSVSLAMRCRVPFAARRARRLAAGYGWANLRIHSKEARPQGPMQTLPRSLVLAVLDSPKHCADANPADQKVAYEFCLVCEGSLD